VNRLSGRRIHDGSQRCGSHGEEVPAMLSLPGDCEKCHPESSVSKMRDIRISWPIGVRNSWCGCGREMLSISLMLQMLQVARRRAKRRRT
jgi:hypothetical protein